MPDAHNCCNFGNSEKSKKKKLMVAVLPRGAGNDCLSLIFGKISHRFTRDFTNTDKKFENDCYIMWKIILTENPSRCNLAPLLK